jgi:DNA end-binding protein Ku
MAPRAYWKGYLKLSLVSCPIGLYPASSTSEKVSFHRINKQTGNRLRQQLIDSETEEPVQKEDVGRGYEVGKREYVEVEDAELEKIEIESSHTIDIDSFVPRSEIDDRYLNITLRPMTRLARRRSRSSAIPSRRKIWWLSPAWC